MAAFDILRTPWALAFAHVPAQMSLTPSRQSAPDPGYDEMSRLPYPDDSAKPLERRTRSAPVDIFRPPADAHRQTTDVRRPVSFICNAFGISMVEFTRGEDFVSAAHLEAFSLFHATVSLDHEQAKHWHEADHFASEQVRDGGAWRFEDDQIIPVRMNLFHATRLLGITRNQHCLTPIGRVVVDGLSPLYGRSGVDVKVVSDLECVNAARITDRVSFELELKRIEVGEHELEYIDAFMSEPGAVLRLEPHIHPERSVTFTWIDSTGQNVSDRSSAGVRSSAQKMLCQVFGQMLCYRTRRVILMTWDKMIVLQLELGRDGHTRSISVSPMIRREDGRCNANIMVETGSFVTEDGKLRFRQSREGPIHSLKPTYISTLLALSLNPCELSPEGFFPPPSLTELNRDRVWDSAIPAMFGTDPSGGMIPPGPREPRDPAVRPDTARAQQRPPSQSHSLAAHHIDDSGTTLSEDDTQPSPVISPSPHRSTWSPPPPDKRIELPVNGVHLDLRDLRFSGVDLSEKGEMTVNGVDMVICEDLTVPMLIPSRPTTSIVIESECIGSGRLGDVVAGKARLATTPALSEPPDQTNRQPIQPAQDQSAASTDVVIKFVCPEAPRDYGEYENYPAEEVLQMFVNEACIYLHEAKSQQGKTIAKCYGFFHAALVLHWSGQPHLRAAKEGENAEYNLYGLLLERLGESVRTPEGLLAEDVDPKEVVRMYYEFHQCGLVHIDVSLHHILRVPKSEGEVRKGGKRTAGKRKARKQKAETHPPAAFKYRICDLESCGAPMPRYTAERERQVLGYVLRGYFVRDILSPEEA